MNFRRLLHAAKIGQLELCCTIRFHLSPNEVALLPPSASASAAAVLSLERTMLRSVQYLDDLGVASALAL